MNAPSIPRCPLCQGETTPCIVVTAGGNVHECHGTEKGALGTSRNRCRVSNRVCVDCGYILLFADTPGIFRAETGPAARAAHNLPIPRSGTSPELVS